MRNCRCHRGTFLSTIFITNSANYGRKMQRLQHLRRCKAITSEYTYVSIVVLQLQFSVLETT